MFGKRQRQAQLEAIERALVADAEARAHLADALTHIDARLEQGLEEHAKLQVETDATVQHLRASVMDTKTDLAQAVEHLAMVCGMLSERIEAERHERQVLVEAVSNLAEPRAIEASPSTPRVLGGTVYARPIESIDVTAHAKFEGTRWHPAGSGITHTSAP
jgi:hypothetical protein